MIYSRGGTISDLARTQEGRKGILSSVYLVGAYDKKWLQLGQRLREPHGAAEPGGQRPRWMAGERSLVRRNKGSGENGFWLCNRQKELV